MWHGGRVTFVDTAKTFEYCRDLASKMYDVSLATNGSGNTLTFDRTNVVLEYEGLTNILFICARMRPHL